MISFSKSRLEAFSDGVIAIIITIMVLDIPLPSTFGLAEITGLLRSILIFLVSFLIVGAQWSNHNMLFQTIDRVSNTLLWRNLLFLFFLSLVPIFTKWIILHPNNVAPALGYDIVYLLVYICLISMWGSAPKLQTNAATAERLARIKNARRPGWIGGVLLAIGIVAIVIFSYAYPRLPLIFFIILPAAFSLVNLIFERDWHEPEESTPAVANEEATA